MTAEAAALRASDALHARVRALIAGDAGETFDDLALAISAFQAQHVEPVGRLWRSRFGGGEPSAVDAIPAVPTDVFRLRRVAAHDATLDVRVFRTSGTSAPGAARGSHCFRTLATYDAAALAAGRAWLLGGVRPERAIALTPSAVALPDSSLSFMVDRFIEVLGLPAEHLVDPSFGLDAPSALASLERACKSGQPTVVFGTAFAYVFLLDALAGRTFTLPAESRLMLTGGFKGKTREVPEGELRAALAVALGLPASRLIGEYGMTELSSQLYEPRLAEGDTENAVYRAPGWVRVAAADPATLSVLPRGERGIARIVDLANVDSAIAIQTLDWVEILPNGDVRLFGRAPGASARGCSLTMEELFEASS